MESARKEQLRARAEYMQQISVFNNILLYQFQTL